MTTAAQIISIVETTGVVAIIRRASPFDGQAMARALREGGVQALEITLNSHNALKEIEAVRELGLDHLAIGAGTVRTAADARAAIAAGAEFIVAPNYNPAVVEVALAAGLPMMPGVATASEADAAWQAGCQLLKFFPAASLGANYLKLLRDPLDDVKFMATGGIDVGNLAEFFAAGVVAIGLGSSLVGKGDDPPEVIGQRAAAVLRAIAEARRG
jgi:2-dehydro-3-deoxyphosphogluconate aldolase/(4S)-4-hydroxy-2-oxoglutarate aldolase